MRVVMIMVVVVIVGTVRMALHPALDLRDDLPRQLLERFRRR